MGIARENFELSKQEISQDDGIPIKYREKDEKTIVELAQTAKTRLQEMFVKRFPKKARKMLRLSSIFETELPKDLDKEIM